MILALNLNAVMKRLVLGQSWIPKRMKAITRSRGAIKNIHKQKNGPDKSLTKFKRRIMG